MNTIQTRLKKELNSIKNDGLYKKEQVIQSQQSAEINVNDKIVLNFCANNYLGLANHPNLIAAAKEGIEKWGFGLVQQVDSPGTFARRGAVVDLFCYGSSFPLRLEYNEDSLRSARTFDPVTQKMVSQLSPEEVLLYPPISLCEKKTNNVGSFDVSFFSVGSSGPAEIYDVRPLFRETTAEVDLVCTSHRSFLSNPASLNTVITRLSEKGVFWRTVFCSKPHASRVSGVPVLDGFSFSHLPFFLQKNE
mgnify:CR=1 FL=1